MPITHSAIKKDRQDKKRTAINRLWRDRIKQAKKAALAKPTKENLAKLQSLVDRGAKRKLFNKSHAARVVSRTAKKAFPTTPKTQA